MFNIRSVYKCMPVKLNIIFISLLLILNSGARAEDNRLFNDNATTIFVPGQQRSMISTDEEGARLADLFRDIVSGDIDQVKRYIYSCKDPTMADMYGNTPLMIASEAGRADIVELLISGKCLTKNQFPDIKRVVNYKNLHGYTALYAASMYADADTIDTLLSAGADSTIPNEHGLSPSSYARALGFDSVAGYSAYIRGIGKRPNLTNVDVMSSVCLSTNSISVDPVREIDSKVSSDRMDSSLNSVVTELAGDNASNSKIDDNMTNSTEQKQEQRIDQKVNRVDITTNESTVESLPSEVALIANISTDSKSIDNESTDTTATDSKSNGSMRSTSSISASLNLGPYAKRYASEWQLYLIYEERSEGFCEYSSNAIDNVKNAAESGDTQAIYWLGKYYYGQDRAKSLGYFQDIRLKGSVYFTGAMYYMGLLQIDDKRGGSTAQTLFCTSADQGDSKAMVECGSNYLFGKGVAVDSAKAHRYLAMGYELREPSAIYYIGLMKYYGYGVAEDKVSGLIDIKQASYYGYAPAYDHIKRLRTQETLEYLANYKRLSRADIRTYILSLNNAAPKERTKAVGSVVIDNNAIDASSVDANSSDSINKVSDSLVSNELVRGVLASDAPAVCDIYGEGDLFSNEYKINRIEICFTDKGARSLKILVDSKVHPMYRKYLVEYSNTYADITLSFE